MPPSDASTLDGKDKLRVLVADDDAVTRRLLCHHLESGGFQTLSVADGEQAIASLGKEIAVALLDLQMPKKTGLDCLKFARENVPDLPVIVISQHGAIRDAVEAMRHGAVEFITKPVEGEELVARVRQAVRSGQLATENRQLRQAIGVPTPQSVFVGISASAADLQERIRRIASLDSTVLVTGESGTGKTTIARLVHRAGPRTKGPFVSVSCASLPRELIESELFGHVKGAFTGAIEDRLGHAEMADGGTLFLDEIGDLPLELQPKLLTFLQDRMVQRIGATRTRQVDVRVIAATNQHLKALCQQRRFREDLYYRLNVIEIEVSPLRDRPEDVEGFTRFLLDRIANKRKCAPFVVSPAASRLLTEYPWPGNVRELENVLERATAFCEGNRIESSDLALDLMGETAVDPSTTGSLAGMSWDQIERKALVETLRACRGNKKAAARMLGIDEKSIYNKIKRLQLAEEIAAG